jgi:hypothetical protein
MAISFCLLRKPEKTREKTTDLSQTLLLMPFNVGYSTNLCLIHFPSLELLDFELGDKFNVNFDMTSFIGYIYNVMIELMVYYTNNFVQSIYITSYAN